MTSSKRSAHSAASPTRTGVIGTIILLLALSATLSFGLLRDALGATRSVAEFTEAGGLRSGDTVIAAGLQVGTVKDIRLREDRVEVEFEITDNAVTLGRETRAAIVSQTALGRRALEVESRGEGELNQPIPLERTTSPYDVTQALAEVTTTTSQIDKDQLSEAMTLSGDMLSGASDEVKPALDGLSQLSELVASRDKQLAELLESSNGVSGVLDERSGQIQALTSDGALLLQALQHRSAALQQLLTNAVEMSEQVDGLVEENDAELGPTLKEVRGVLATTRAHRKDIDHALKSASPLLRELGEVVAAFPGFNVYIPNLPPTTVVPTLPQLMMGGQG